MASLGDVIITDKVGKTAYGTMTVVTKTEREEYTVTINAPTEFLTNPTTVYPVIVDPTFTIEEEDYISEGGSDGAEWGAAIHDLCIYNANGSSPGYPESSVGAIFYNEDSGEMETARMLYRINPDYFEYDSIGNYFSDSRFSAATLYVPVNSNNAELTVSVHPYTAEWGILFDENDEKYYANGTVEDYTGTVDYNSYDANVCVYSTVDVSSFTTVGFDITDIVEYWRNNNCYDQGLILGCADDFSPEHEVTEPVYLDIRQTEHTSSDVYISVDYGTVVGENYINNKQTGHFLEYYGGGTSATTSTYNIYTRLKWKITYYGNNQYIIKSSVNDTLYLCSRDGLTAKTVSYSGTITNEYLWTITYNPTYDGYLIKNVAYNKYLKATDSNTTSLSSTLDSYCAWRLKEPSKYRNLTSFSVEDIVMKVGETATPVITVTPANATWANLSDFSLSSSGSSVINISNNNTVNAFGINTFNINAVHNSTGIISNFKIEILPVLIYRTRNRERLGFADSKNDSDITPIVSEDLSYGAKSTNTLISNGTFISLTDLYYNIIDKNPISLSDRRSKINAYCLEKIDNSVLSTVFTSMMNHFVAGSGTDFSSEDLTNAIVSHSNTSEYTQGVISIIKEYLNSSSGNITGLYYDEDLWTQPLVRKNHPMVNAMLSAELYEPCYDAYCGEAGLMLCVDSLYGNKFEIESYELNGTHYSGVLKFTFYDHFGLDTTDLQSDKGLGLTPGYIEAFRQWYILQHWDSLGYATQPKPFVTIIEFSVPFSGNVND